MKTERRLFVGLTLIACFAFPPGLASSSEPAEDPGGVVVDEIRNDHPSFMVRVDVDKPDRVYCGGEEMTVKVVSAKSGYLYVLYCDAGGM